MYVKQEDIRPIEVKDFLVNNWDKYGVADTRKDFIALLNILQACDESLDSLHRAYMNGSSEFCDIFHGHAWESDKEIADALLEFSTFYTTEEFVDMILSRREDYDDPAEYVEDMRMEASDNVCNDVQITKTDDGYVKRVWY